jgi:hypothetical protein
VSVSVVDFALRLVDKLVYCRGKSTPMPALLGDTIANTSDDEAEDVIPQAGSGTSSDLVTADDNPF